MNRKSTVHDKFIKTNLKEQHKLLERARDELQKHEPMLMTNAEFYIQSQADESRDVWFVVGKGQNKFICYVGSGGEPVAYLEQGSEKRSWFVSRRAAASGQQHRHGDGERCQATVERLASRCLSHVWNSGSHGSISTLMTSF